MKLNGALTTAAAALSLVAADAAAEIKIGASLPLTGAFSIAGSKHEQGYQLCVDLINERGGILGEQVELILSDNRSDPATAINQYERFINVDGVDAVFGTFSSRLSFRLPTSWRRTASCTRCLPAEHSASTRRGMKRSSTSSPTPPSMWAPPSRA